MAPMLTPLVESAEPISKTESSMLLPENENASSKLKKWRIIKAQTIELYDSQPRGHASAFSICAIVG